IPNSVTSIGSFAFSGCSGLNSLTIGNSVANIGVRAFERCNNLEFIKVLNPIPPICSGSTFTHYDSLLEIPEGSLEAYQQANEWCNFTNISGISGVENIEVDDKNVEEVERYDINGRRLSQPTPGINIIKMSDGSICKKAVR
ncbi:MAG: leucine-rich repeat protein, partial [Muribaculaceae bacterium]|nr:leucine-rich repeat protein [Muribaculaceae bacterium]